MILHLTRQEKFTRPFINFIQENFEIKEHFFLLVGGQQKKEFEIEDTSYIKTLKNKNDFLKYFIQFNIKMYKADKIIIHGLSQPYSIIYLFFNPWLLKKTYWIIWGADLYGYLEPKVTFKEKVIEFMKSSIIKNIGHVIGSIKGEYKLAQKWYGINATWHHCFVYPTKFFNKDNIEEIDRSADKINILIGNSASPSNEHLIIFDNLKAKNLENVNIYVPLSYGDEEYAKTIIEKGTKYFGKSFFPLTDFMPLDEYNNLLANIDIALFAHKRQQAINNIVVLLGLGKKVYIRSDITSWDFFNTLGIKIFDIDELELTLLDNSIKINNREIVANYFSKENLVKQFSKIW